MFCRFNIMDLNELSDSCHSATSTSDDVCRSPVLCTNSSYYSVDFQLTKCLHKSSDLITYNEREYSDVEDTICQSFELKYDVDSSDNVIIIKVLIPVIPL